MHVLNEAFPILGTFILALYETDFVMSNKLSVQAETLPSLETFICLLFST